MSKSKNEIGKVKPIPEPLRKMMAEAGFVFNVGDLFVNSSGHIYRVSKFEYHEKASEGYREKVYYQFAKDEDLTKWDNEQEDYLSNFLDELAEGKDFLLSKDYKLLKEQAIKIFNGEATDKDLIKNEYAEIGSNSETALIGRTTKDGLVAISNALQEKRDRAGIVAAFMRKEIDKKHSQLLALTKGLYAAVAVFQEQITKLMRVITTIELYLGIGEEMHQIKDGQPAPASEPITFRQMVLFIDEEVGAYEDGGLDWRNIERFDEWLVTDNNIDRVVPEQKCMVVMKPRRYEKDYGKDAGIWGAQMNALNLNMCYFLIRNGEKIYRIYTDKIGIGKRWLPLRSEFAEYQEKIREIQENDLNGKEWQKKEIREIEDKKYQYTNQTLLMQGLIDRTEVFHPLPLPEIKLMQLHQIEDSEKYIRFVYDDEMTLPSGRLSFFEWKEDLNSKIKHGTRILIAPSKDLHGYGEKKYYGQERLYRYYSNSYPSMPPPAVYMVEEYRYEVEKWLTLEQIEEYKTAGDFISYKPESKKKDTQSVHTGKDDKFGFPEYKEVKVDVYATKHYTRDLTIMYNPKDQVDYGSGGWGDFDPHERKNRLRFKIHLSDEWLFNYDQLDIEDVNFYLQSRVDRHKYLDTMPILKQLRKQRKEELKQENLFGKFIFDRNFKTFEANHGTKEGTKILNKRIHECLVWWKFKNELKRPITKDDTLALRMIEQRINSKNYDKLKTLSA
jgi:hypothetical protein